MKLKAPAYLVFTLSVLFLSWGSSHASLQTQTRDTRADHLLSSATSTINDGLAASDSEASSIPLRGISRLLARSYPRAVAMTCNSFPRICRAKGSPGPDCCKKQCVNVMADGRNCGQCGKKCKYGEACCGGNCINIMYDRRNCGGCRKRCKKGSYCRYGMCSYA